MTNGTAISRGAKAAQELITNGISPLSQEEGKEKALEILNRSEIAMVGSNGELRHKITIHLITEMFISSHWTAPTL